jgi:restriction system protein
MARRRSFLVAVQRAGRAVARHQRQVEAAQRRDVREQIRHAREQLRLQAQYDKAKHQEYLASRAQEAEDLTADTQGTVTELRGLLDSGLKVNPRVSFDNLLLSEGIDPFRPPLELATSRPPPRKEEFTNKVKPVTFWEKLFSRDARYRRDLETAHRLFTEAENAYRSSEAERVNRLSDLLHEHETAVEKKLAEVRQNNADVNELHRAYLLGESDAVTAHCSMVLEHSRYPDGFPHEFRLAYVPASKEVVIEYELPKVDIVPVVTEHRYIKSKDVIEEKARKVGEIRDIYQDVVASIALRTLHEVIEADEQNHIAVIVLNACVNAVDPATGRDIKPCLLSVRTTKERFVEIDLRKVEKKACLRNLGAQVSPQPAELLPVKPLIEFDMVDRRFVQNVDVLADLESRPNLMDLNPFEFERLVGNLFAKMGLESKLTRSSRDGGVDVVAFDTRPLIGGKVVIQAKRYSHTVGVSAVRDLFGTMNHEGANKGILVTTSSYGPDAYDFIRGKPIELIDGGGLLYYLEQHTGMKCRIVFAVEQ